MNRVLLKDGVPEKFKLLGHPPLSHLLDIKCLIGIPVQAGTRVNEKYGFSQSHPALILRLITNSSYLKHTINILLSTAKFNFLICTKNPDTSKEKRGMSILKIMVHPDST